MIEDDLAKSLLIRVLHPNQPSAYDKQGLLDEMRERAAAMGADNQPTSIRDALAFLLFASDDQRVALTAADLKSDCIWAMGAAREYLRRTQAGQAHTQALKGLHSLKF